MSSFRTKASTAKDACISMLRDTKDFAPMVFIFSGTLSKVAFDALSLPVSEIHCAFATPF